MFNYVIGIILPLITIDYKTVFLAFFHSLTYNPDMKKQIITIAGNLGAGKTSTADKVSQILGYERLSTGAIARSVANDRGLTITEWNKTAEADPSLDHDVDMRTKALGRKDKFVLDSRLAWYFIPESFKVFLLLDPATSAERILASKQNKDNARLSEIETNDIEVLKNDIDARYTSERKRYKELYNIDDHMATENFDLIVNTKINDLDKVTQIVVDAYKNWLKND